MTALGAFVTVDKSSPINKPAPVLQTVLSNHEPDNLNFANRYSVPSRLPSPYGVLQASMTPNEIEMSQPPSPTNEEGAGVVQTLSNPPMNKYRLLSACLMCFGNGINGKSSGFHPVD